ncbi:unnamed protein product [Brassica rapa subsp. trilocularis]
MVTRSYTAYLSRADERLGIQVRVFEEVTSPPPIKHVMDQIVACTQREKLLPEVDTHEQVTTTEKTSKLKAVLVTSLTSGYSESLKINHTVPDPPCGRAISMEPCFHVPPVYGCNGKTGTNTGNMVPFVRHCEDRILGIKLVQDTS